MDNIKLFLIVISFALIGSGFDLLLVAGRPDVPYDRVKAEFHIYDKADLDAVAVAVNDPNNWWKSLGETFILHADITTFTGIIGTKDSPFMGTFNGSGHRIDIDINKPNNLYVGLFGKTQIALVKNLTVTGSVIGKSYVGGIVGYATGGEIEHCTNLANVTAKAMTSTTNPPGGGQVGVDDPLGGFSTYAITNNPAEQWGGYYAGGIVGYCNASGINIDKCANDGYVHAGNCYAGGIIGHGSNMANIISCINIGTVRSSSYVGGIAGSYVTNIENSLNGGFVSSTGGGVGGIIGSCGANNTIRYCLNTGVVYGNSQTGSIAGYMPITTNAINNFYDKQMSSKGGINGSDVANRAVGRATFELTDSNLFTWSSLWTMNIEHLYPTPKDVGNIYYSIYSEHDYDNIHVEHVAAATLKLQSSPNLETTDNIQDNVFFTYEWASVIWTPTLNNVDPLTSGVYWTAWDTRGTANRRDTMVATCYAYSKQVPIYIPVAINKNTIATNDINTSIGEVTPNIVTASATIDIQTATEGNLNVSIYDLAGTKIANITDKYIDANTSLQVDLNNLSNLSTGSYMAIVSVGNEVVMRKFIKQ